MADFSLWGLFLLLVAYRPITAVRLKVHLFRKWTSWQRHCLYKYQTWSITFIGLRKPQARVLVIQGKKTY